MIEVLYMLLPPLAIAAFASALAYFSALHGLSSALRSHGPALLAEYGRGQTPFARAYAVLNRLRRSPAIRAKAAPEVLAASTVAFRRLVLALACIMALFAVGLTISVAKA